MDVRRTPRQNRYSGESLVKLSRYDLHLFVIPFTLLASILAHIVVGVALQPTLVTASLVGMLVIVDAVFLNSPTQEGGST